MDEASPARDAALAAAASLLRNQGVSAITIPAVARRARLSVRTVRGLFASREELVVAALYAVLDDVRVASPRRWHVACVQRTPARAVSSVDR
jgi:AcrR family transcriptional regulator